MINLFRLNVWRGNMLLRVEQGGGEEGCDWMRDVELIYVKHITLRESR